ncbi:MAG: hypothetical protein IH851_11090 [Armatimonadetes bacterium]|nr:hypothetical protein [Armatimonadota bacterium]
MKRVISWMVMGTAAVAMSGCGLFVGAATEPGIVPAVVKKSSLENRLIGKWKGEIEMPEIEGDDFGSQMAAAFAEAFMSSLSLELNDDKSFTLNMFIPIEGNWEFDGSTIELHAESVMGFGPDKFEAMDESGSNVAVNFEDEPLYLHVSPDGRTLPMIPESEEEAEQGTLTFTKENG